MNIIITPVRGRPGAFAARREGSSTVICVSRSPFLDSARSLLAAGHDPNALLKMRHDGAEGFALTAPLGTAAKLVVEESAHGPVFRTFRKGLVATTERPISDTGIAAPIQPIIPPEKGSPGAVDPARNARLELPLDDQP